MIDNVFFVISLVAFLIFLDYYLTLVNYRWYTRSLAEKIEVEQFELNPQFQEAVYKGKYSPTHFFGAVIVLSFIFFFSFLNARLFGSSETRLVYEYFLFSLIVSQFVFVIFQHLRLHFIMRAYSKKKSILEGHVKQRYEYTLMSGEVEAVAFSVASGFLFVLQPTSVTFGFMCGPLLLAYYYRLWRKKHARTQP